MTNKQLPEREPICGMCWAIHRAREPLKYDIDRDIWQCRRCRCIVSSPTDGERTAEDIEIMFAQREAAKAERAKEGIPGNPPWRQGLSGGQVHLKGNSSGRRRSKEKKKPTPWYNGPDRVATER